MAQKKIRDLTTDASPSLTDILETCKNPDPSGTPLSRKITLNAALALLLSKIPALSAQSPPAGTDLALIVHDPSGTPSLKKATISDIVSLASGGSSSPLETETANNSSPNLLFTSWYDAAIRDYTLRLRAIQHGTTRRLKLLYSIDSGANWITAGNYDWSNHYQFHTSQQGTTSATADVAAYFHHADISHLANTSGWNADLKILNPGGSSWKEIVGWLTWVDSGVGQVMSSVSWTLRETAPINGLAVCVINSGNMVSGYGQILSAD